MVPLSSSLLAHQKGRQRLPALRVIASGSRGGVELLRWTRYYAGGEADSPHAACLAGDGSLIRVRNAAGAVMASRVTAPGPGSTYSSWSQITSLVSGGTLALAAKSGEVTLVTANGTYLDVRHSTDNGASWGSSTTRHTAAAAITSCAVAYNPDGDLCVFFTVTSDTNVYRLRRTAGTWGSAVGWSRSSSVAGLTGVAAAHDGLDFQLVVTGTAVTTTHKRAWGVVMGDLDLAPNTWTLLSSIGESDSGSTVTFGSPAIAQVAASLHGFYAHAESAAPAFSRAMYAHPPAATAANGAWTEPGPHEAQSAYGVALVGGATSAWLTTPGGVWYAAVATAVDLSARVTSSGYRVKPDGGRCKVELDNGDGAVGGYAALAVGGTLSVSPGYRSGTAGAAEYGATVDFTVDRVLRRVSDGRATVVIEASTPLEQLALWEPPQTWQTAAGAMTRAAIAQRIAGRAGFKVTTGTGALLPSNESSAQTPAFAVGPSQHGDAALERLLQVTPDFLRADQGTLTLVGLTRYRNAVMASGPLRYWRLNDGRGATSAVDETGAQDGTYNGSPALEAPGFLADDAATCGVFDGVDDSVSVASVAALDQRNNLTMSFWIRITGVPSGFYDPLSYGHDGSTGWVMQGNGANFDAIFQLAGSASFGDLRDGQWHHCVAVKSSTSGIKAFVDGVKRSHNPGATGDYALHTPRSLTIGRDPDTGRFFPGAIAEVTLWNRDLGDSEVAALYAAATASDYTYSSSSGSHPVGSVGLVGELPARNWVRVQGAGKYADAVSGAAAYAGGPQLEVVRNLDASTDVKVRASAKNALRRRQVLAEAGELVCGVNAGAELYDLVTVSEAKLGLSGVRYRVIGVGVEYRRGPKGARYDSVFTLGGL